MWVPSQHRSPPIVGAGFSATREVALHDEHLGLAQAMVDAITAAFRARRARIEDVTRVVMTVARLHRDRTPERLWGRDRQRRPDRRGERDQKRERQWGRGRQRRPGRRGEHVKRR